MKRYDFHTSKRDSGQVDMRISKDEGDWVRYDDIKDALALLRELNDALVIPGWLQSRVDAILDRSEESCDAKK